MSQRPGASNKKYYNKGTEAEERKNKSIGSTSSANGQNAQCASSIEVSTIGKKYVTKMKLLKSGMFKLMNLNQRLMMTMLPS